MQGTLEHHTSLDKPILKKAEKTQCFLRRFTVVPLY